MTNSSPSHVFRFERLRFPIAAVTAGAIATTIAFFPNDAEQDDFEQPPVQETVSQVQSMGDNDCSKKGEARDDETASACSNAQQRGSIALVSLLDHDLGVESYRSSIEDALPKISTLILKPDIEIIPISDDIRAIAQRMYDESCDPETGVYTMHSQNLLMLVPELREHDYVVAFTEDPSCDGAANGLAYGTVADVYNWKHSFVDAHADMSVITTEDEVTGDVETLGTTVHEIGHLYGLGHAGSAQPAAFSRETSNEGIVPIIDHTSLTDTVDYYTYGNWNLMGFGNSMNPYVPLDQVQLRQLRWPDQVRGDLPKLENFNHSEVFFPKTSEPGAAVTELLLDQPLQAIPSSVNSQVSGKMFNRLSIAYQSREMTDISDFPTIELNLVNGTDHTDMLELDDIKDTWDTKEGQRSVKLMIGTQRVLITFNEEGVRIKDITPLLHTIK